MKENLMVNCKACGKEIAKGVKKCVHCGKDQRIFFMKHKILSGIIILFLISAIGAVLGGGDNEDNTIAEADSSEVSQIEDVKEELVPEIIISAPELVNAYESNEVKANKEYGGKVVEVSGEISDISIMLGKTFVILSSGQDFSLSDVQCFFDDEVEISKIENLSKGQQLTVVGTVDGKSMNIGINNCIIK